MSAAPTPRRTRREGGKANRVREPAGHPGHRQHGGPANRKPLPPSASWIDHRRKRYL